MKLDLRNPAHKGMVNLTATLADIPPEHRLDAVATFVRACTDTTFFTKPGFECPREGAGAGASRERSDPSPSGPGSLASHDTGGV